MTRLASTLALCTLVLAGCQKPAPPTEAFSSETYVRAVAFLYTQARSPDPTIRANCIEALQGARDPRAVEVIEQGLHDQEWVVRFAAAMAAGKRQARTVLPILETMAVADDNGSVRVASIYALKQMDRPAHMNQLSTALVSRDPSTRANAALVLGLLGDPSAISLLQAHRAEPDIRVRFEITAALARLGDEAAQKVVVSEAVNRFAEDQWIAMQVCADLPPAVGESPLILGLQPAPRERQGDPNVVELTTRRQLVAARSLAKRRNGSGAAIAISQLKNTDPTLRALALLALGDMLTPSQVGPIEQYLQDSDDLVRRAAAAAIVAVFSRGPAEGPMPGV